MLFRSVKGTKRQKEQRSKRNKEAKGTKLLKEHKEANIQTQFKDLNPFAQEIELKIKALWQSVTTKEIEDGIYVVD